MQKSSPVRQSSGAKAIAIDQRPFLVQYHLQLLILFLTTAVALAGQQLLEHLLH